MLWTWGNPQRKPTLTHKRPEWACKRCGARNSIPHLDPWPHLPRGPLYIGHDKYRQLKLYPIPPGQVEEIWAVPYSIRSFVFQASQQLSRCAYSTSKWGEVMGEPVFSDRCRDGDDFSCHESWPCYMVGGWTKGKATCPLWEEVSKLCQTEIECKFLHWYLGLVKDRQFPMLIPQARIGIAERRRPDFVLFVPLQYWKYKWYAIQLDKAHGEGTAKSDELRDTEISIHGYEVIRLKPEDQGYLEEVKRLVEMIELEMGEAESNPWGVAVLAPTVLREEAEDQVPF